LLIGVLDRSSALCNQIISNRASNASTWSFQIFGTFAVVDPTQRNPWVSRTHGRLWANALILYALLAAKQHKKHPLIVNQNVLDLVSCLPPPALPLTSSAIEYSAE